MKSGQILSRNNSKTVLNIVFKFYTLVTEYMGCLQRQSQLNGNRFRTSGRGYVDRGWKKVRRSHDSYKERWHFDKKRACWSDLCGLQACKLAKKGLWQRPGTPGKSFPVHQEPWWPPGRSGRPPHIFKTGLWVNTNIYLEVTECTLLPWIKTVVGDRPWMWPLDPAPCHVSNRSIKWLKDHSYDLVLKDCWPPSSPDPNPLDYFVWGYLGTHTNRGAHTTKASLITSIKENFAPSSRLRVAFWSKMWRQYINLLSVFYFK